MNSKWKFTVATARLSKRALSILLTVLLLGGGFALSNVVGAQDILRQEALELPEDVIFSVPEVIYLQPNINGVNATTNFQFFVDNTLPTVNAANLTTWGGLSNDPRRATGNVWFSSSNATMVRIEMLTPGVDIHVERQTRRNYNAGAMTILNGMNEMELDPAHMATLGGHGTVTNITNNPQAINNADLVFGNLLHYQIGQDSTTNINAGHMITWRATYLVSGMWYTTYAYSYVFRPDHIPSAVNVLARRGASGPDHHTMNWINGLHAPIPGANSFRYAPTAANAAVRDRRATMPYTLLGNDFLMGTVNNATGSGATQLGHNRSPGQSLVRTPGTVHYVRFSGPTSGAGGAMGGSLGATQYTASLADGTGSDALRLPQNGIQMVQHPNPNAGGFATRPVNLFVDTSRYSNYNQIPNLSAWATNLGTWHNMNNAGGNANERRNQYNFISWSYTSNPMREAPRATGTHVAASRVIPNPVQDPLGNNASNRATRAGIWAFGGGHGRVAVINAQGQSNLGAGTTGTDAFHNYRGLGLYATVAARLWYVRTLGTYTDARRSTSFWNSNTNAAVTTNIANHNLAQFKFGGPLDIPMMITPIGGTERFNAPSIVFRWHSRSGDLIRTDTAHYRVYMNIHTQETNKAAVRSYVRDAIAVSGNYQRWMFDNANELVGDYTRWEIYTNAKQALAYALNRPDQALGNITALNNAMIAARNALTRGTPQTGVARASHWNMASQPPQQIAAHVEFTYDFYTRVIATPPVIVGFEFATMNIPGGVHPAVPETNAPFGQVIANTATQTWNFFYAPVFHVVYNGNGADSGSAPNSGDIVWGRPTAELFPAAASFERYGHSLIGWSLNAQGTGVLFPPGAAIPNTLHDQPGAVQVFAIWAPNTHTITYHPNEGTGTAAAFPNTFGTAHNIIDNSVLGFDRTNFDLVGWNTDPRGEPHGTSFALNGAVPATNAHDITLYAQWQGRVFNVIYRGNGGVRADNGETAFTNQGRFGEEYTASRNNQSWAFSRGLDAFVGWNTQPDGSGTAFALGEVIPQQVADGLILYAQWLGVPYTVHYNANTGADSATFVHVNGGRFGEDYTVLANAQLFTFTLANHVITGWNTQPDGQGTSFLQGQAVAGNILAAQTLYAMWEGDVFTVAYHINDGSAAAPVLDFGQFGEDYTVLTNNADTQFVRPNFTFAGWNTRADGLGDTVAEAALFANDSAAGLVLFAQWVGNPYTVTYAANNSSGDTVDATGQFGNVYTVAANTFTRSNFQFVGWNTQANGSGIAYAAGHTLAGGTLAGQTLYAQWLGNPFTVTFNPLNGNPTFTATVNYGNTFGAGVGWPAFNPAWHGYDFVGWFTQAVDGDQVTAGNIVQLTGDLELFAQWVVRVDFSALLAFIALVQPTQQGNYTQISWDAFQATLAAAQLVAENANATQPQVDGALAVLITAFDDLEEYPPIDTDVLVAFIQQVQYTAQGNYSEASWLAFRQALEQAMEVAANPQNQDQVDQMLVSLTAAYNALVADGTGAVDKTALEAKIAHVQGMTQGNFGHPSWAVLQAVLGDAQVVAANANVTQEQVNAALAALVAAYEALALAPSRFFPEGEIRLRYSTQHEVFANAAALYGAPVYFVASPEIIRISHDGVISYDSIRRGRTTVTMYCALTHEAIDSVQIRVVWSWQQWTVAGGVWLIQFLGWLFVVLRLTA